MNRERVRERKKHTQIHNEEAALVKQKLTIIIESLIYSKRKKR